MKKIKGFLKKAKESLKKIRDKGKKYYSRNFGNTKKSLDWLALLLVSYLGGTACYEGFQKKIPAYIIGSFLSFFIMWVLLWIAEKVLQFFLKGGCRPVLNVAIIMGTVFSLVFMGNLGREEGMAPFFAMGLGILLILLFQSLWGMIKNKVQTPTLWISAVISGIALTGTFILLCGKGFKDDYIRDYLALSGMKENDMGENKKESDISKIQEFGSYTVESLQYSPEYKEDREGEIPSDTVDLSFFTVEEKGLDQRYRKIFQTFDLKTAPIAGKIWYPKEKFNCPVLFIAHGNHSILSASYLGYDYLGEYLASNGYVVVSVDENVLNMRQGENDARAVLLLENIKKVKAFQGDTENPLYKKMDYEKIAIAGHSRGGEMTAVAYLFNSYDCYPENGMKRFNYHFNIQSIIAIAPTVDQYMPTEQEVMLEDVNYLLLHGANDQDVSTFMGNTQYENINFSGKKEAIKSSLYIAGANHGQFNSEWGQYDQINPVAPWLNVDNFISEREQQNILKLFVRVFLDKTLQNKEDYGDLLTHYEKYQKNLPKTIYIQRSQTEDFTCLADFEEDSNLETATWKEASIRGYGMQHWKEEQVQKNQILTLDWKNTKGARLEISLKGIDLKDKSLQFDICDKREYEEEESPKAIDAKVVLLDENGNKASLRIKEHQMVYPSLPVKLSKLEYLFREKEYKSQYQTVMLPTTAFRKEGNHFDFCKVKKLSIYFDTMEKGKISMDNIGFTN